MKTQSVNSGQYVQPTVFLCNGFWQPCYQFENSLRRHNYVGFVHALLAAMAKSGTLEKAKVGATEKMKERIAKMKEKGENAMDED